MSETSFYRATVVFAKSGDPLREIRSSLLFIADDDGLAVHDVFRWADNRMREQPNVYGPCVAMSVCGVEPQRVMPNGYLPPGEISFFYLWDFNDGEHGPVRVGAPSAMFDSPKKG